MSKTIDIKSLLIGFLLATSVMLSMGAITSKSPNNNTEIGRYQLCTTSNSSDEMHEKKIFETIIDTKTGKIISREKHSMSRY